MYGHTKHICHRGPVTIPKLYHIARTRQKNMQPIREDVKLLRTLKNEDKNSRILGIGLIIHKKLRKWVINFWPIPGRLCKLDLMLKTER